MISTPPVVGNTRDPRVRHGHATRKQKAGCCCCARFVFVPTVLFFFVLLSLAGVTFAELGTAAHDLSNFQGKHTCDPRLKMATPTTVHDVASVVAAFPKVRPVGVGHSWNGQLFCAGTDDNAIDVVTSAVRSVDTQRYSRNSRRSLLGGASSGDNDSSEFNPDRFEVNPVTSTVKTDAGATVRELLDFLEKYRRSDGDGFDGLSTLEPGDSSVSSGLDVLEQLRKATGGESSKDTGYTLAAFPWFIDQTIGGAVATATHGSSLRHGSLSSQVVGMTIVLANGTVSEFSSETTPLHIWNACRANLGRLGVVVDLTLKITKNHPVRKTSFDLSPETFVKRVEKASEKFKDCEDAVEVSDKLNDSRMTQEKLEQLATKRRRQCATSSPEMRRLDETQAFWFFPLGKVTEVSFSRLDDFEENLGVLINGDGRNDSETNKSYEELRQIPRHTTSTQPLEDARNNAMANIASSSSGTPHVSSLRSLQRSNVVRKQPPDAPRDATDNLKALGDDTFARFFAKQWERSTEVNVESGVFDARDSYLTMSEQQYDTHDQFGYDQYETCVPMRLAGACLRSISNSMRDAQTCDVGGNAFGFRSQGLIRFINEEDAYLAPTNAHASGTCMYVNIEDFVRYADDADTDATPDKNKPFQSVITILRSDTCKGRLHWGKAGFPNPGCFDGSKEFGTSWCHFTCAARVLDPDDKFVPTQTVTDVFSSEGFDKDECCDGDGLYLADRPGCACETSGKGVDLKTGQSCGKEWY